MTSSNTTKLNPNTTYTFEVAAINGAGVGERSSEMRIRTLYNGICSSRGSLPFQYPQISTVL